MSGRLTVKTLGRLNPLPSCGLASDLVTGARRKESRIFWNKKAEVMQASVVYSMKRQARLFVLRLFLKTKIDIDDTTGSHSLTKTAASWENLSSFGNCK